MVVGIQMMKIGIDHEGEDAIDCDRSIMRVRMVLLTVDRLRSYRLWIMIVRMGSIIRVQLGSIITVHLESCTVYIPCMTRST